jgi:hypothetical protein
MLPQSDGGGRDQEEPGGEKVDLEGNRSYLEGTWRVVKTTLNILQLKKKDHYLVVRPGEQAPGREGDIR